MDEAQKVTRQQRGEATREALLQAGVELLQEETLRELLSAMSSRDVATRAQRSTGSFFHHWSSAEAYVDDLIAYIFRSGLLPENVDEVASGLDALAEDAGDPIGVIRAICYSNFLHVVKDPFLPVELLLRSQSSDDKIRAGLRGFYREVDAVLKERYEAVVSMWHREPRPPLEVETLLVVFTALLEGLALRYLIEPDKVPPTLYGEVILAWLPVFLRARGDTRDIREFVAELVTNPPPLT